MQRERLDNLEMALIILLSRVTLLVAANGDIFIGVS